jgi:tRNA threonylcarbamoyladenosine biosynthesis protein TsaB
LKILAIDTSGEQTGAAIIAEKNSSYITVGEITINARLGQNSYTHSEILMPAVEQLFELTRLTPADIDFVAYVNGPGSFTGLRIGVSSALGIARGLKIPAIAVPTLDALAYNVLYAGSSAVVVPTLDARRGQVYSAVFERGESGKIERKSDYLALHVGELLKEIFNHGKHGKHGKEIIFLGDGADANRDEIMAAFPKAVFVGGNSNRQRASSAGLWAAEKIREGMEFTQEIEILYVRAPQAVREAGK